MGLSERRILLKSAHYSPLRYPGGKAKLAEFVKALIVRNNLSDGEYVEPYAGGAGLALELLLEGYVHRIRINNVSRAINAFWWASLNHTDQFCEEIERVQLNVERWRSFKDVFLSAETQNRFELGFATFVLNRTNRSGILNGGPIGGYDQTGKYKIDARFNRKELIARITRISKLKDQISITRQDAVRFIREGSKRWPEKTLVYCDPPYFTKGRDLYYDFYEPRDHQKVAKAVKAIQHQRWIVSYDDVEEISSLYAENLSVKYGIGYSARGVRTGKEVMFFGPDIELVDLVGPIHKIT